MVDHIFRQYDIRGKIGSELAIEDVYALVQAIAYYFKQQNPSCKTIVIGADGRTHSPAIKEQLCTALQDSGFDVVYVGTCPTPVVYFGLHTMPVDAGLMITASHNGKEYNGIKICLGKNSVWGEQIQEIKRFMKEGYAIKANHKGSYREYPLIDDYLVFIKKQFAHLENNNLSFVIDCGNGAAGTVLPPLIAGMNWHHVRVLYPEVDGTYPHHEADPTVIENMQDVFKALTEGAYAFGAGLDGDCDRMACMTRAGELVQGDKLLAVFAQEIIQKNPKSAVVFDVKCSSGLSDVLTLWGAKPCISPSGHSLIKKAMKEERAILAGELSCHFFFNDRYFGYDDGIYALMRLVERVVESGTSLEQLLAVFPQKFSTKEIRIECEEEQKATIVAAVKEHFVKQADADIMTIDGVRVSFPYGWGILRSSNTQPVLCLRFESDSKDGLEKIKNDFVVGMLPYFDEQWLRTNITL
jgi:phosphomannomutase/phosphoglucomutase